MRCFTRKTINEIECFTRKTINESVHEIVFYYVEEDPQKLFQNED